MKVINVGLVAVGLALVACSAESADAIESDEADLTSGCAGDFRQLAEVALPTAGLEVLLADVDGDGRTDLVTLKTGQESRATSPATADVSVSVHRGDGKSFEATPSTSTISGHRFDQVYAADFDGDGKVDLAYREHYQRGLYVALRDGQGWKPATQVAVPLCGLPSQYIRPDSLVVRDLDRDGRADILLTERVDDTRSAMVLLRGGAGGLPNAECVMTSDRDRNSPAAGGSLIVGDYDGDGKIDVASHDGRGTIRIVLDLLGARRSGGGRRYVGIGTRPVFAFAGRADRDGHDDLFLARESLFFTLNGAEARDVDGTTDVFQQEQAFSTEYIGWKGPNRSDQTAPFQPLALDLNELPSRGEQTRAYAGDLNGDGLTDLYFVDPNTQRSGAAPTPIVCSRASAAPRSFASHTPLGQSDTVLGIVDVDGDKRDEIVVRARKARNPDGSAAESIVIYGR